jgi:hypothetical protein
MEGTISKNINKVKENLESSKEQLISIMADVARLTSDNPEFDDVYTALKTLEQVLTLTDRSVVELESSVKSAHSSIVELNNYLG